MLEVSSITAKVITVTSCILALVSMVSAVYQFVGKQLKFLSAAEDEFLDKVGFVTEVLGFVTLAGCTLYKFVPKQLPKPFPRPVSYDPVLHKMMSKMS